MVRYSNRPGRPDGHPTWRDRLRALGLALGMAVCGGISMGLSMAAGIAVLAT